jgi:tRNA (cmo5U34)-methyltransferase
MTIDQAFNASAEYYDSWVKKAILGYQDVFAIATELIPFDQDAPIAMLDLGAGTGLFSQHVLAKYPRARFVLYDVAANMLDIAKGRFRDQADQFQYIVGDYRHLQDLGDFELVISSLSIHHLADQEKKALFERIFTLLRDKGVFINVDQIKGPTPALQELYWTNWLDKVRRSGATEEQIQASIQRRISYDQDALLADQLQWLREAGFVDVDCIYKNYFVGVFYAAKE